MILKQLIKYANAPAIEATWVDENDVVIKCHAYSNHPEQMDMLRADLGADAAEHEALIAEIEATYVPPEPPTPEEIAAQARAEAQAQIDALEIQHQMPRITRESLIALAEERALAAGLTLEQLRAKNKGYAGLKALDEQIAALRAKL